MVNGDALRGTLHPLQNNGDPLKGSGEKGTRDPCHSILEALTSPGRHPICHEGVIYGHIPHCTDSDGTQWSDLDLCPALGSHGAPRVPSPQGQGTGVEGWALGRAGSQPWVAAPLFAHLWGKSEGRGVGEKDVQRRQVKPGPTHTPEVPWGLMRVPLGSGSRGLQRGRELRCWGSVSPHRPWAAMWLQDTTPPLREPPALGSCRPRGWLSALASAPWGLRVSSPPWRSGLPHAGPRVAPPRQSPSRRGGWTLVWKRSLSREDHPARRAWLWGKLDHWDLVWTCTDEIGTPRRAAGDPAQRDS